MNQTDIMLAGEADAWFKRNRGKLGADDPVGHIIAGLSITPRAVLEIGCANGWRLKRLQQEYRCHVWGVDPSHDAVEEASLPGVLYGTADDLPFCASKFDLVIFGFCLYLCDPADLFRVAAEADRVLADGGTLIIHDFADIEHAVRAALRAPRRRARLSHGPRPVLAGASVVPAGLPPAVPGRTGDGARQALHIRHGGMSHESRRHRLGLDRLAPCGKSERPRARGRWI
jgi:SAM-dependent methyltransferase